MLLHTDPFALPQGNVFDPRKLDPFAVPPATGHIRRWGEAIRQAVVERIATAEGYELTLDELRAFLTGALEPWKVDLFTFPVVLRFLERETVKVVRAPGVRLVRLASDDRPPPESVKPALGALAAGMLDLMASRDDDQGERVARREIADAVAALPAEDRERIVRTLFAPEIADQMLAIGAAAEISDPKAARVLRVVRAGGRDGVTWTRLRQALNRALSVDEIEAAVAHLESRGLVWRGKVKPLGNGRPGVRVVAT